MLFAEKRLYTKGDTMPKTSCLFLGYSFYYNIIYFLFLTTTPAAIRFMIISAIAAGSAALSPVSGLLAVLFAASVEMASEESEDTSSVEAFSAVVISVVESSVDVASVEGFSVAGSSVEGTSVLGTSVLGASVLGASVVVSSVEGAWAAVVVAVSIAESLLPTGLTAYTFTE